MAVGNVWEVLVEEATARWTANAILESKVPHFYHWMMANAHRGQAYNFNNVRSWRTHSQGYPWLTSCLVRTKYPLLWLLLKAPQELARCWSEHGAHVLRSPHGAVMCTLKSLESPIQDLVTNNWLDVFKLLNSKYQTNEILVGYAKK